ncbi:MAG: 4-oxalocrotonate tautomerase family protein [Pasteurella sp.]|nr:4-oxalocrotonate tautomerase family protein [Pasteurella sp.]
MPVINITMTCEDGGATQQQKEDLVKGVTDVFSQVFNGRGANSCVVIINEVSTDNYGIGGELVTKIREK